MGPNLLWELFLLFFLNENFCHGFWGKPIVRKGYSARIAGGHVVRIENHKHHVHLFPKSCGGTIIGIRYILSARECDDPNLTVKVGYDTLEGITVGDYTAKTKQAFNRKQGTLWPSGIDYQTLFIELNADLTFSNRVGPVPIGNAWGLVQDGKIGTIAGFGATDDKSENSLILHAVEIPLYTHATCVAKYGEYVKHFYEEKQAEFCGGYDFSDISRLGGHHSFCKGDIGGGLIMDGALVGVAVRNYGCGEGQHPGIFESNAFSSEWLFHIVGTGNTVKFQSRYVR